MTKQTINLGTADKGNGDPLRTAFTKVNDNFTELYVALGLDAGGLNLGAFEFTGSVMSTTDSSAIVIDQAVTVSSDLTVGGNLLPNTANGGDLGSLARPWRSLYVSNTTIYIGGVPLSLDENGNLLVDGNLIQGGGGSITTNATAPVSPTEGNLWYDTVSGRIYIYYDSSWVDASPVDGAGISSTNELVNGASSFSVSSDGTLTLTHPAEPNYHPLSTTLTIQKAAGNYHTISGAYGLSLQATPVPSGYGLNTNTNFVDIFHDGVSVNVNDNTWIFGTDGKLTLPNGSTIGDGDAVFGVPITTTRGSILIGNQAECLGGENHFHIMKAGQQAIDLFLGDDNNYVKLPSTGGVEISSSEIGAQHYWTFGTDGNLTAPGTITAPNLIVDDGNISFLGNGSGIQGAMSFNLSTNNFTNNWNFSEDGNLALPSGNSVISNLNVVGDLSTGSQIQVGSGVEADTGIIISNGTTNDIDGSVLQAESVVNVNGTTASMAFKTFNSLGAGGPTLTGEEMVEVSSSGVRIGVRATNDPGDGSPPLISFRGWTFDNDELSLPIGTVISETPSEHGLYRTKYSGNFVLDPTWFAANTGNIVNGDSFPEGVLQNYDEVSGAFSFQYFGYFVPPTSANYTFRAHADETFVFWIGSKALSGYTYANKDMYGNYNGTFPEQQTQSFTIALTAGEFYPIRIQWANSGGGGQLDVFTWANDSGQANTADFTGRVFRENTGTAKIAVNDNRSIILSTDNETDNNWTFAPNGSLTFPDATVQTTAYIPGDIRSEGNIDIEINLSDSTLRRWTFGEDGNLTLPAGGNILNSSGQPFVYGVTSISTSVTTGVYNDASGDYQYGTLSYDYAVNGVTSGGFSIEYSRPLVGGNVDIHVGNTIVNGDLTLSGDIRSEGNIDIDINLSDSTLRRWSFGEDGSLTLPSVGKINNGAYDWTFGGDGRTTFPATTVPAHSYGAVGDKLGMVAFDGDYIYYCKLDYVNNVTDIWVRSAWTGTNW